jgi:hypothetical protein
MRRVVGFASSFSLAFLLAGSPPLHAQSERLVRLVDAALDELRDPDRARDAARRLEHLGPRGVRLLAAALQARDGAPDLAVVRCRVLLVLARLGRDALPALPSVEAMLADGDDDVVRHAVLALTALAPFLDAEQRRVLLRSVQGLDRRLLWQWGPQQLLQQLQIAGDAEPTTLRVLLEGEVRGRIAAARHLAARAGERPAAFAVLTDVLAQQLERAATRAPVRWRNPPRDDGPDLALAWLAVTQQPLAARPARLLLDHWHPDERARAIAWLHDHGAALPLCERADLVGRLWDLEPALRIAAARAFAHWGGAARVALPALRGVAQQEVAEVRAALTAAADAVAADATGLDEDAASWLAAADAALRWQHPEVPRRPCPAAGCDALAELLYLAQWNGAASIDRVLSLVEQAGDCRPFAIQSVLGWLHHDDPSVVDVACAWLARRGAAVREHYGAADRTEFERFLRDTAQGAIARNARRTSIELLAHLTVAGDDDHVGLLQDANSRVVAHALATAIVARGQPLLQHIGRLHELLHAPSATAMRVIASDWDPRTLPIDLSAHVRTLAAIALVDLGAELPEVDGLDDVVRHSIGVALAELPRHVKSLRAANRLPALLDQVADQCRLLMSVPPHLRWPSLASATR